MAIENSTTFIAQSIEADASRGGWIATGFFANDQDEAVYQRRVDVYFTMEGGGVWESDAVLGMRGSMFPQNVRLNIRQSQTQVTIATSDAFLNTRGLQGIYFTEANPVTHPHEITNMRLGKIVKHIIEQHCNVSSTGFVQNTDGTFSANPIGGWVDTSDIDTTVSTRVDVFTVRQSNSMWQTLKQIADNEKYVVYMTKRDEFVYQPHPVFDATPASIVVDLDSSELAADPEIVFRDEVQMDQVVLAALTDDGEILRSRFPSAIGTDGRKLNITNLRCNEQSRLDQLAQRAYSFESRTYDLRLFLPGVWGLYLELYDRISLTYSGTSRNGVSLSFSAEPFFIDRIRVNRQGDFGAITELGLTQENLSGTLYAT
jgi:hypothetical protein